MVSKDDSYLPFLCASVFSISFNDVVFLHVSKEDASVWTYKTMTVDHEEEKEGLDPMVGVEVQVQEEGEQPMKETAKPRNAASLNPMSVYLSDLKTVFEQNRENVDLQSPTNYYDANSPTAFDRGKPDIFFQGAESIPIVQEEGYYDAAEKNRYRKIQALNGFGWQGPIDEDCSL